MILGLACLYITPLGAQPGERRIHHYAHEVSITVQQNKVSVTVDHQPEKLFDIVQRNGNLQFSTDAGKKAFAALLQLNEIQKKSLSDHYQVPSNMLEEKLLTRAVELKGLKLSNDNGTPNDSGATNENSTQPASEELTSSTAQTEEKDPKTFYFWLIPAAMLGLLAGYFLGKNKSNRLSPSFDSGPERATATDTPKSEERQYAKLQKKFESLQLQFEQLTYESQDRIQFDKNYFTAVNQKIISGFWDAINRKDETAAMSYSLKAAAQLTAITRLRLDIEQSFDQRNIDELTGRGNATANTAIDAQTNKDSIPDQISTLISIMQKNGIKGLDQTNFQGYTLNQLDV